MNDEHIKSVKVLASGIMVLLLLVFLVTAYSLFKKPVVTKSTIDSLVASTELTQQYVKELRDMAYQNKLDTQKDNELLNKEGKDREQNYQDLYDQYDIDKLAKQLQDHDRGNVHSDVVVPNRLR